MVSSSNEFLPAGEADRYYATHRSGGLLKALTEGENEWMYEIA